jgi:hypothetical protein
MLTDIGRAVKEERDDTSRTVQVAQPAAGCLPIVNFFLHRMELAEQLLTHLPHEDPRLRLAPA